jgi:RNA polymerase sigma-70 factor (ECF subfamily)
MSKSAEEIYERVLVLRCRAGDAAAFDELIECFQPRLRYYLRQMVHESRDVEDLLQDVWLDVLRGIPRLIEVAAFRNWIYRIARVRVLGEYRKRWPDQPLSESDEPIDEADFGARLCVENAEQIHAALRQLSDEHREVLTLHFLEEMSYESISSIVGCPTGTVRSRIHYAKRSLRGILEGMSCHE